MARHQKPPALPPPLPSASPPLDPATWAAVVKALGLSPQLSRIVELILRSRRDKEIAAALGLTVPTVWTYLGRIFLRVGVKDHVELVVRVFTVAQALQRSEQACRPS
jgi:DNA-binding CsgD family transcriptional regulator